MKNNWDLSDYETVKDIQIKKYVGMIFLFLITIGIIIILCKFNLEIYEEYILIKDGENFSMMVESEQISFLEKNETLYIDHKEYHYTILNVDSNYTNINNVIYQTIYINPYNYNTEAVITNCYLLRKKQTIYEMIIEFIKGGKT